MSRRPSPLEIQTELKPAFDKVFVSADPWRPPFTAHASDRLLIWPIGHYMLNKDQFAAVCAAALAVGEHTAWLSVIEGSHGDDFGERKHAEVSLEDYDQYGVLTWEFPFGMMGNALYSPHGHWGVLISIDAFALFGGIPPCADAFKQAYPHWREKVKPFLKEWEHNKASYGADTSWIPSLLDHLFGKGNY